jgi:transcription initiation factor TFIIIB Brf1 subunit/transcription initiation factor TFIIB
MNSLRMPTEIQCPKCKSANVMFSKKRNLHICEDCQCEFVPEKVVKPMRIFLSYGHDANEELVRRIKADLEKRGHYVWFTKTDHRNAPRVVRSLAFQLATDNSGKHAATFTGQRVVLNTENNFAHR